MIRVKVGGRSMNRPCCISVGVDVKPLLSWSLTSVLKTARIALSLFRRGKTRRGGYFISTPFKGNPDVSRGNKSDSVKASIDRLSDVLRDANLFDLG